MHFISAEMSNFESTLQSDLDDLSVMINELLETDASNLNNIGFFKKLFGAAKKAIGGCIRSSTCRKIVKTGWSLFG